MPLETTPPLKPEFQKSVDGAPPKKRKPPYSLRFSDADRSRLEHDAAGMSLAAYVRWRLPVWVAIDDNTVGYDILSYERHDEGEINRLIEVKTTRAVPPRMILSRNEWETAARFGAAFEFHLWNLNFEKLTIFTVDQIRPHIPTDNGSGKWENLEIRFTDLP